VIPDGALRTIPFSAFYDGKDFLIQKFALATTPGISLTLPKRVDATQATLCRVTPLFPVYPSN
jgi:CHAT domain-containing protein